MPVTTSHWSRQITLEKFDPMTGATITRTAAGQRAEGLWRVKQVALPTRHNPSATDQWRPRRVPRLPGREQSL